jgi:uncharacterized membrane protein
MSKKTMKTSMQIFIPIAVTIALTVLGQLLVKQGAMQVGSQTDSTAQLVLRVLLNFKIVAGLACAVLAALSWMVALSRTDLSYAYPFMGLAIVLVLALTPMVLGERIPVCRWIGVLVVCVGLWIASRK